MHLFQSVACMNPCASVSDCDQWKHDRKSGSTSDNDSRFGKKHRLHFFRTRLVPAARTAFPNGTCSVVVVIVVVVFVVVVVFAFVAVVVFVVVVFLLLLWLLFSLFLLLLFL